MKVSINLIKRLIIGAGGLLIIIGVYFFNLMYNTADVSHQGVSYRLGALCAGIYEYHEATGQWPGKVADLAGTPMAACLRYWQDDILSGRVVVLWPRDWQSNPKDNADKILAYYTGGLISEFGKQWVCWGDLRTEYLSTDKLQVSLKATETDPPTTKNSKLEPQN